MFERSILENIIVNAPLGIVTTDREGRITFINRTGCRIHHSEDPLHFIRKHISILVSGDSSDFMLSFHKILNCEVEKSTCEYSVSSTEESYVRSTMTLLRDGNYNIAGTLIMCEDITGERTLAGRLIREKIFSESVIETANLLIVGLTPEGNIMLFNRAAESLTGFSREEVLSCNWFDLFVPRESKSDALDIFYASLDGPSPAYHEQAITTRSGESRLIGWHQTCMQDSQGHLTGVIAIGEDITEKRQLEENLIGEREKLDRILTSIGAGLMVIDSGHNIVYTNALIEKYFGQCIGMKCYEPFSMFDPEKKGKDVCAGCPVCEVLDSMSGSAMAELKTHDKDGKDFWVQLIATPVTTGDDNSPAALELVIPIEERKKLEEQLMQSQKMEAVGILAGGVAHDFNNIIGAILGYSTLIKGNMPKTDSNYKYAEMIESASRRASDLAERLLCFSRKAKQKAEIIELNDLVKNVIALMKSSFRGQTIIRLGLSKRSTKVTGDKTQLEQLLMNLLINARDAMPKGGTIEIKTSHKFLDDSFCRKHLGAQPGENAIITVSDTGTGMPEETRKRIFEPFFTTKKEGEGTGLGLSIAYSVIRAHKGYIDVESEQGKGTKFTIYLPISKAPAKPVKEEESRISRGTETVLVVDDENVVRSLLNDMLTSLGYKVLLASDGDEALELFRKSFREIDLAIIDMVMPGKDGKKTLEEMRVIRPDIRAIISAGKPIDDDKELISDGDVGFLSKPYKLSELMRIVREKLHS